MALATKCPHCNTIFRVAADQLKLRGGIVRCGTCKEVFDGNAALLDPAAALLPAAGPVATPLQTAAKPTPALIDLPPPPPPSTEEAVYSLDFDTSFDPFGILPETTQAQAAPAAVAPVAAPEPVPVQADELALDLDLDAETALPLLPAPFKRRQVDEVPAFATYLRDNRHEPRLNAAGPAPAMTPEPAAVPKVSLDKREPSFDAVTVTPEPVPAAIAARQEPSWEPQQAVDKPTTEATPEQDAHEPAFVTQGRRREQSGKALQVALAAGSVFLLLLVLLQIMTTFRNPLAAQFPQFKPALSALCGLAGCKVDLPAQIEALAIEQGELQTLSPQTFSYVSLLRNHSRSVQAWPSIELTLDDSDDKPVLRRVITPHEYLPAKIDVANGLAPRSEQTIKVYFKSEQARAAGYHIAIFYP
ncbi:DUF3426 domain-containing protein [Janthinobacterium aquaticum]|uniref:DUF3426 domain-containing protein n=1 Tax=Janthinobacterium sp. FT58W TaxID=2654254 RepID=UPI001265204E|nr:DUF3426 domain-containing protein [Janthinobacterium sp. FT58W]KAB8044060.1 DUF3426 domain-containing protein [Janthinobacterium sp. FT58W]